MEWDYRWKLETTKHTKCTKNGTRMRGMCADFQEHEYAQIDTNASTMDLCWVGIGETKNSMKIETRIKVWVERNKKHGYARINTNRDIGIRIYGYLGILFYYVSNLKFQIP